MNILSEIHAKYNSFTQKEQLIADYILTQGQHIQNMNISVLAATVGVSDGTITRFCRKIQCASFADLKIGISRAASVDLQEDEDGALAQVYNFYKAVIEHSNQLMDRAALLQLADEVRSSSNLYIYGVGNSGLTATELMLRLLRMGFHVQAITDPHLMLINSSILTAKDRILAISISGETADLVNAVRVARQNGCPITALTSFPESSLALQSDFCFPIINTDLVSRSRFMNSQFSVIYVIDLLCSMLLREEDYRSKMDITVDTIIKQSHIK